MTDKKISALTAATTPLAGTEVLPIVQSGATVKVAVNDLTAGRAITATLINKVAITTPATSATLTIADGKTLTANNSLTFAGTDATTMTFPTTSATVARTDAANSFTGNQTLSTGNLIVSNGKGIDFSATPGTGTSELFADYEEGTFSPTYEPQSGAFGSITYGTQVGRYTKVGNAVHVAIGIRTTAITVGAASGFVAIGGLPFTSASTPAYMPLAVGSAVNFGTNTPSVCFTDNPGTKAWLAYRVLANGGTTFLGVTDLSTGASNNYVFVCGTYFV